MTASVEAVPRDEFDEWLEDEGRAQEDGNLDLGEETFTGVCAKCHGLSGEGGIGPPLRGNQLLNDPDAVDAVVRNGRGEMPPVGKDWGERQMDALTDFLQDEVSGGS